MKLGEKVYYVDSINNEPAGILVGLNEVRWSDSYVNRCYVVQTARGSLKRIYSELTNIPPKNA